MVWFARVKRSTKSAGRPLIITALQRGVGGGKDGKTASAVSRLVQQMALAY